MTRLALRPLQRRSIESTADGEARQCPKEDGQASFDRIHIGLVEEAHQFLVERVAIVFMAVSQSVDLGLQVRDDLQRGLNSTLADKGTSWATRSGTTATAQRTADCLRVGSVAVFASTTRIPRTIWPRVWPRFAVSAM